MTTLSHEELFYQTVTLARIGYFAGSLKVSQWTVRPVARLKFFGSNEWNINSEATIGWEGVRPIDLIGRHFLYHGRLCYVAFDDLKLVEIWSSEHPLGDLQCPWSFVMRHGSKVEIDVRLLVCRIGFYFSMRFLNVPPWRGNDVDNPALPRSSLRSVSGATFCNVSQKSNIRDLRNTLGLSEVELRPTQCGRFSLWFPRQVVLS